MVGHFNEGDSFGGGKLPQVKNSRRATIWPRFFLDPLIAGSSASQNLLPRPGSPQHSSDSNDRVA